MSPDESRSLWSPRRAGERPLPHLDSFVDETVTAEEILAAFNEETPLTRAFRTPVTQEALLRWI